MKSYNYKKAIQALNFFAVSNGGTLNKMKGLKLLFLADRLHLRKYGRTISQDTYYAFKLGPVASNTRDILDCTNFASLEALEYGSGFITPVDSLYYRSKANTNLKVFSTSDKQTLEIILLNFGNLNEFQLSDLSHKFPEWKKFEKQLLENDRLRIKMDFLDFFKEDLVKTPLFLEEEEDMILMSKFYCRQ